MVHSFRAMSIDDYSDIDIHKMFSYTFGFASFSIKTISNKFPLKKL